MKVRGIWRIGKEMRGKEDVRHARHQFSILIGDDSGDFDLQACGVREVVCDVDVDGAPGFGFVAAGGEVGDVVRDFVGCCGCDVREEGEGGEEQRLREKHLWW